MASVQEASPATSSSPITINFTRRGVLPPVYLAADFTETPWEPIEMDFEADQSSDSAHFNFHKTFPMVKPGDHQYKFRLGPGEEGWTVDGDANMAVDKAGHENNWIFVKSPEPLRHPVLSDPTTPVLASSLSQDTTPQEPGSSAKEIISDPGSSGTSTINTLEKDKVVTVADVNDTTSKSSSPSERPQAGSPPGARADASPVNISLKTSDSRGMDPQEDVLPLSDPVSSFGDPIEANHTDDEFISPRWTVSLRDDVPSDLSTDAAIHARSSKHGVDTRHDMHASMVNQYWDEGTGTLQRVEGDKIAAQTSTSGNFPGAASVAIQDLGDAANATPATTSIRMNPESVIFHKLKHRHQAANAVRFQDAALGRFRRDVLLLLATATLCALLAIALYLLQDDDPTPIS